MRRAAIPLSPEGDSPFAAPLWPGITRGVETRCQLVPDPVAEPAIPCRMVVARLAILDPGDEVGGLQEGESGARSGRLVDPRGLEDLKAQQVAVEPPALGDAQSRIDTEP